MPYYTVHTPIQGKPEKVARYEEDAEPGNRHFNAEYAAMIDSLDENVGRLMAALREQGLDRSTLVVFVSDNGGVIHTFGGNEKVTSNLPLRSGKGTLWEGGIRVPMIARWPGVVPAGTVCSVPVVSMDFLPTFCELLDFGATITDLCGVEFETDMRGRNVFTDPAPESVFGIIEIGPYRRAGVRNGKYRMDCTVAYNYKLLPESEWDPNLFDVENDPFEENNLARNLEKKPIVNEMYRELRQWLKQTSPEAYSTL